jgi:hypothetical protein
MLLFFLFSSQLVTSDDLSLFYFTFPPVLQITMILRSRTKNNRHVIHEDEAQIKTTLPRRNKSKSQDSHHEKVTVPVEQPVIMATSDGKKRDPGRDWINGAYLVFRHL